jgi:hypothetical protein
VVMVKLRVKVLPGPVQVSGPFGRPDRKLGQRGPKPAEISAYGRVDHGVQRQVRGHAGNPAIDHGQP